jgi:predicted negative regulator of RcsB-dependent stress response
MAVYDLEEQEKLDDLKAFWKRWGNAISTAVIAVCIAYIAVQGWRWWTARQAEEASVLYGAVSAGVRDKDAKTQYQWAIDRATEDELKAVARYRLAEALLDEKAYDQALAALDAKHPDPFAGLYADLRGDVLVAAGRAADARSAYQAALAKLDAKSPYRNYVQVKLDALGGASVPAAAVPGGSTTAAPPPAAVAPAPAKGK